MAEERFPYMSGQRGMLQPRGFSALQTMPVGMIAGSQPVFPGGQHMGMTSQQFHPEMPFYPGVSVMRIPGAQQVMFPVQSSGSPARPPPPPYTPRMATPFQLSNRTPVVTSRSSSGGFPKAKTEKERHFEQQQQRLRQFGRVGAQMVDANKLIENIFGKADNPSSNMGGPGSAATPHSASCSPAADDHPAPDDDGFGDFLGGPSTAAATPTMSSNSSANIHTNPNLSPGLPVPSDGLNSHTSTVNSHKHAQPKQKEKKDLMSMMLECSDLNAPQKAKGFHKPSLIEVQRAYDGHSARSVSFHESSAARRWDNVQELEGLFVVQKPVAAAPVSPIYVASPIAASAPVSPTYVASPIATAAPVSPTYVASPIATAAPVSPTYAGNPIAASVQIALSVHPPHPEMQSHNPEAFLSHAYHKSMPPGLPQVTPVPTLMPNSTTVKASPVGTGITGLQTQMGTGMAVQQTHVGSSTTGHFPEWCYDSGSNLPVVYRQVFEAVVEGDRIITERLHPILLLSSLPREHLGMLWGLANTHTPGQLIRSELWMLLGMIALVQNNYTVTSLDILKRCPNPPVPYLGQSAPQAANSLPKVTGLESASTELSSIDNGALRDNQALSSAVGFTTTQHQQHNPTSFLASSSVVSVNSSIMSSTEDIDDDFADFQAAPVPVSVKDPIKTEDRSNRVITEARPPERNPSVSVLPAAADRLEKIYAESVTLEDKYSSNVRSFFCSSDSSTGHTTPNSLDDEDLTDEQESTSQVSTSEQSENEDIRAFENYVEEFNRKRESHAPHSSMHHSFPHRSKRVIPNSAKIVGDAQKVAVTAIKPTSSPTGKTSLVPVIPVLPPAVPQQATFSVGFPAEDDEFTDFKSAVQPTLSKGQNRLYEVPLTLKPPVSTAEPPPQGDVLIGDEDKYGALRELIAKQPSLFELTVEEKRAMAIPGTEELAETKDAEEWADFSDPAMPVASTDTGSISKVPPLPSAFQPFKNVHDKEMSPVEEHSGWANFEMAPEVPTQNGHPHQPTFPVLSVVQDNVLPARPGDSYHVKTVSNNSSKVHNFESSAFSSADSHKVNDEDDWAEFATADITSGTDSFSVSKANASTEISHHRDRSTGELFTGKDQTAVITVRKKNLESAEIMGLFKVRSDPATLSSYELPKRSFDIHKSEEKPATSRRRQGSKSKESQGISDVDDDFGTGPPPLEGMGDDDDHCEYVRGYDLDDLVHQSVPTTIYSPYGFSSSIPGYTSPYRNGSKSSKVQAHHSGMSGLHSNSLSPDSGETDSISNRVASLREDSQSVSSLELPVSKMSADVPHDSDNGETDSQSVSSMEFGTIEAVEKTDAGAESKSLDSLDLRNYDLDMRSEDFEADEGQDDRRLGNQKSVSLPGMLSQGPILGDRYNIDGHNVEGSDRYVFEWERCLSSCSRLIQSANNIFNTISSSAVCNEVLRSPSGTDYIIGIIEIYRVVARIMASMSSTAITSLSIEQSLKDIDLNWNNLIAFLVGASLLPEPNSLVFTSTVLKSDSPAAQQKACGVCLLDVDSRTRSNGSDVTAKLSYGGRQYHAPCANFWVNCVDSMLPHLRLPELL